MALSIDELREKVAEMIEQGLNTQQIADELSISQRTVMWLNSGAAEVDHPDDIQIGWRTIGARPNRINAIGAIMADIVVEELENRGGEVNTIVGISLNGILFANSIADQLEVDVAIFRSVSEEGDGHLSNKYGNVAGRKVVVVDDVLSSGETMRKTIKTLQDEGAEVFLSIVMVNKTEENSISSVPLRGLIRTVRV
ncbi:MAG TPA: orotate phosphoribosyltransferase-like protein [Candidatus Thalassarchaeaceae archaeon]|nr:orotate phosphoribosyltransferase-like protein [Candidatus Thalassarchaeaceae archaeon]HJM40693.1 orotate phosphoribosyltransferase-like protein [Candidatus Thalassarchaeaceae archaeon]